MTRTRLIWRHYDEIEVWLTDTQTDLVADWPPTNSYSGKVPCFFFQLPWVLSHSAAIRRTSDDDQHFVDLNAAAVPSHVTVSLVIKFWDEEHDQHLCQHSVNLFLPDLTEQRENCGRQMWLLTWDRHAGRRSQQTGTGQYSPGRWSLGSALNLHVKTLPRFFWICL